MGAWVRVSMPVSICVHCISTKMTESPIWTTELASAGPPFARQVTTALRRAHQYAAHSQLSLTESLAYPRPAASSCESRPIPTPLLTHNRELG